ncbi:CocE/NonD family hydrolase [Sphingosinicella rhizophila]|uniref:CocE/NonD family hydrolase n=1 Tax=Sphingosinicella rhizophila TaxID=3050082 RepID=A0ABU3QBA6_9SPHN|nr:CocE/NonD family hydrolase [Sphingosinicella sp. GR2756]MDT9600693.1 CocE/NonD family hydrolase [Sphingosinicella sp. GR2756]
MNMLPFLRPIRLAALGLMAVAMAPYAAPAQEAAVQDLTDQVPPDMEAAGYVGDDVMIPMRDGVKLHAQVWRPKGVTEKLPILMSRSPYGYGVGRLDRTFGPGGSYGDLAADKFIFVFQDLRGRFGSEGEYVTLRTTKTTPDGIDESTDTYDSIEWLVKNLPDNNGKVGVFGVSYGGWTAAMATINPHPALKAVSSQASPEDMWMGDDFLHNGAFRLDYAWSWVSALETDGRTMKIFDFDKEEGFTWYLKQTDLASLDKKALGRTMPSWQNFVNHPNYDEFWKKSVTSRMMPQKVGTPNLIVAGWYDQEDFYGPMTIYENQEKGDEKGLNYLVVGPWNHGGWRGKGLEYGPFQLGAETGTWFRKDVELPWFRYWLKGQGQLNQPEALVFQTGSNQWQRLKSWPPEEGVTTRNLYLRAGGKLSFEAPSAAEAAAARFVSDPANPVPYRERAAIKPFLSEESTWSTWIADDQAPFAKRPDVLFWQTEPLTEDIVLSGDIVAKLFASTTGSDADWVVKLVDIYPTDDSVPAELRGRQRMIANDVFRGRFRESYEKPRPITPNKVLDYRIDLHSASHVFKKGHRIGVQVQSSWFPLINRNPQTYVDNVLKASPADFKAQTHAVYHNAAYPSAISVTVASPVR